MSGAELSLYDFIERSCQKYEFFIVLPKEYNGCLIGTRSISYFLYFEWFYITLNPIRLFQFSYSTVKSTFQLIKIINRHRIDLIYANTEKANLYAVIVQFFTKKKIVWVIRDNIKNNSINKILIKRSDILITVSKHILGQLPSERPNKYVVYGGADIKKWIPETIPKKTLKNELSLQNDTLLVAQVGQLTRWKNQFDFIKVAELIRKSRFNVHFLIIGDDLSGREKKYKTELFDLVNELRLKKYISFLGNRQDIIKVLNQIDILIHTAINEPFGRVIIEAMSMEKPVLAYNFGGPKEIIMNNETGYLINPYDIEEMSEKAILLLKNKKLRKQFGKAGRKRVSEKFNIDKYVKEMEYVLDSA